MRQFHVRTASAVANESTELELCVLAIVASRPACTAYTVRRELESSLSSFWSSSNGSVYPLMKRLLRRRLLTARRSTWGKRGKVTFVVSASGEKALRAWLGPPLPEWAATFTVDPIRTRLFFLDLIPAKRRRDFVRHAIEETKSAVDRQRKGCDESQRHSLAEYLGRLGALRQLEARARWLEEVAQLISKREG